MALFAFLFSPTLRTLPNLPTPTAPLTLPPPPPVPNAIAILQAQDRVQTEAAARRVNTRMRALQLEAERLASEARTLLGDLRKLEVDRGLEVEKLKDAETAAADARVSLAEITSRLDRLEAQRIAQLPDLRAQLVDIYKRGRGGYARLLLGVSDVRDFGRATRAVASLVHLNEQRIAEHRRTLTAVRTERMALEQKARELALRQQAAAQARAAADRAVAARATLIERIDTRRDLNAQLAGELQVAYDNLRGQLENLASGRSAQAVAIPLAPFRGDLRWPVVGSILGRFGQPSPRLGGTTARNGIEIAAPEGTPVRAVHSGTVGYAEAFAGFNRMVILDHGDNQFSVYGYLDAVSVAPGDVLGEGAEVGRVGSAPAGPPALYFELRIDGRSVDPVQWLRARN